MGEIEKSADTEGYGFNVTSMDVEETDIIVGHDSYEYNKAMLKGRPYFSKKAMAMIFEVENIAEEFLPRKTDEILFPETFDYSANFKFNDGNFLTSTVIDEIDFLPSIKRSEVSDALLKLSAVELKLSFCVKDILNDLNQSKEVLRRMENGVGGSVQKKKKVSNPGNDFE